MSSPWIEWAMAGRARGGEVESGDQALVAPFEGGVLLALADGLGHGPNAAVAGRCAIDEARRLAPRPPTEILVACHAKLRGTRGAVLSLASLDATRSVVTWTGIGNVAGVLLRLGAGRGDHEALLARAGVLGDRIPDPRASELLLARGDVLLLASDGIRQGFTTGLSILDPPQVIADRVLQMHGRSDDDALALVVRWLGPT